MRYVITSKTKLRPARHAVKAAPKKPSPINYTRDWAPRPTLWYSGHIFVLGDVTCVVEHKTMERQAYYEATITYYEGETRHNYGRRVKDESRQFIGEQDARDWCIEEALRLHGYQAERVITINGMEKSMKHTSRAKKTKKDTEPKCKVTINAGKTKVRTEMNQKDAKNLMELLRMAGGHGDR